MPYSDKYRNMPGINLTTLQIKRSAKEPVRLDENVGIIFLSFDIDAPSPINSVFSIPNFDGAVDKGTNYEQRAMVARFFLFSDDKYNYASVVANLISLFDSKDYFQIIDEDRPDYIFDHVKLSDKIEIERQSAETAIVTIPMVSYYPYALYTGSLSDLADELGYPSGAATRSFASTADVIPTTDTAAAGGQPKAKQPLVVSIEMDKRQVAKAVVPDIDQLLGERLKLHSRFY